MKTLIPIKTDPINFSPYGQFWYPGIPSDPVVGNAPIKAADGDGVPIPRPLKLGLTFSTGGSFICDSMERHNSTEEYLFPGETELILVVANDDPSGHPQTDSLQAFRLPPGAIVCLRPGIWHAPCHSLTMDSFYYFMAHNNGSPDETQWFAIQPEPMRIACDVESPALPMCDPRQLSAAVPSPYLKRIPTSTSFRERLYSIAPGTPVTGNKIYPYMGSNQQLLAKHIIFQDENICTGNSWKCWMTEADCCEANALLHIHALDGHTAACPENTAALFCGSVPLTCQIWESPTAKPWEAPNSEAWVSPRSEAWEGSGTEAWARPSSEAWESPAAEADTYVMDATSAALPDNPAAVIHLSPGELLALTPEVYRLTVTQTGIKDNDQLTRSVHKSNCQSTPSLASTDRAPSTKHWFYTLSLPTTKTFQEE